MSGPPGADGRFARQDLLPGLGEAGRVRIQEARVHVVGAGPLAAPALRFLAAAGVSTIWIDDGEDVGLLETPGWLYPPGQAGRPRLLAALDALAGRSPGVEVRPFATGVSAGAVLVCAASEGVAHLASERARQALLPQVVALGDTDGGEVGAIPLGAPCLRCATGPAARAQATGATAAAVGSLAALELLLLLAGQAPLGGRRHTLAKGRLRTAPTARRPGCGCART
jgi:hypothetical protein